MKRLLIALSIFALFLSPQFLNAENGGETYEEVENYKIRIIERDEDGEVDTEGILKIDYDGMVPCGRCLPVSVEEGSINPIYQKELDDIHGCENSIHFETSPSAAETYIPCTFCHGFIIFDRIISFVLGMLIPAVALIVIVGAGVIMITSSGNPEKTKKAKDTLLYAAAGMFLAYFSWAIITIIISTFMDWDIEWGTQGFQVQEMCEAELERGDLDIPSEE